jgi:hypothetical protein
MGLYYCYYTEQVFDSKHIFRPLSRKVVLLIITKNKKDVFTYRKKTSFEQGII